MKFSIDPKYPGYVKENVEILTRSKGIEVYLNGELIQYVVAANSDNGTVVQCKKDRSGRFVMRDSEFVTELKRGNVCIFIPDDVKDMLK